MRGNKLKIIWSIGEWTTNANPARHKQTDDSPGRWGGKMKTRIVYPKFWFDEKFAECKLSTKLLFVYLITNDYLKLSRYSRISDRRIMFETGLSKSQLDEAKNELQNLKWCFFEGEWIYHNHECAYVDYFRNEKVESAKQSEIDTVPAKIVQYFNECCLNTVQTPFKHRLNINPKLKNINNKLDKRECEREKTWNEKKPTDEQIAKISTDYQIPISFIESKWDDIVNHCQSVGKPNKYKDWVATLRNWVKKDSLKLRQEAKHDSKIAFVE